MKNKTERKKMSPFKKLMILLMVILLIFGGWNLSWYLLKLRPYQKLAENLELTNIGGDDEMQRYFLEKDGYSFTVFMPGYLGFEGGACRVSTYNNFEYSVDLNDETKKDPNEVTGYSLYYYPAIFGEDDYGFFVETHDGFTPMHVSKDLDYVIFPEENLSKAEIEEDKRLIKENYEALEKLMEQAISMWG